MTAPLPPSRTDAGLVARYVAGERHALADIYERWADAVHHRCVSRSPTSGAADRAYRDTFLAAARDLSGIGDPNALGEWLLRQADLRCGTPSPTDTVAADATGEHIPSAPITLWSDVLTELMADPIPAPSPLPAAAPIAAPAPIATPAPVATPTPAPAPARPATAPAPSIETAPRPQASPDATTRRRRPAWVEPFIGPASALASVVAATAGLMVADAVVHQLTSDDGSRLIVEPAAADPSTTLPPLDTTPPTIVATALSETAYRSCSTVGGLAARVSDDDLVAGVHVTWAVGDDRGVVDLTRGDLDTWTGSVGPFSALSSPLGTEGLAATFTVTAIDSAGNITSTEVEVPAVVFPC